jgi:hypothetical protein
VLRVERIIFIYWLIECTPKALYVKAL